MPVLHTLPSEQCAGGRLMLNLRERQLAALGNILTLGAWGGTGTVSLAFLSVTVF